MYSLAQIKAIIITPMITGSVSAIASGALITAILRSETKLSVPSKRILFGLCVHDCLLSLSAAFSSLPIPVGEGIWGAIGNVHTCDFQGFISHVGYVGSALYNCNLSIYYLCVIRFSMSDVTFQKKVEPFCHIIPNLYAVGGSIYLLSKGYFNSIGNLCWIGPYPIDCINDPEVECLRGGEDAYLLRWIFLGYALYLVWAVIIITMISIVFVVVMQRRKSERWASGGKEGRSSISKQSLTKKDASLRNAQNQTAADSIQTTDSAKNLKEYKDPLVFDLKSMRTKTRRQSLIQKAPETMPEDFSSSDKYSDPYHFDVKTAKAARRSSLRSLVQKETLEDFQQQFRASNISSLAETNEGDITSPHSKSRPSLRSSGRRSIASQDSQKRGPSIDEASRQVQIQALLYIFSFVICWVFNVVTRMLEEREKEIPFIIFELGRIFNPIQGLFNVLVYCRPYVRGLRSHHPEYSWWRAFCLTVKSGGDNNASREKSSARRKKPNQKVLDKIRQNHIERMESIRHSRRSSLFDSGLRESSNLSKSNMAEMIAETEVKKEAPNLDMNDGECSGTGGGGHEDKMELEPNPINDYIPCNTYEVNDEKKDLEQGVVSAATSDE